MIVLAILGSMPVNAKEVLQNENEAWDIEKGNARTILIITKDVWSPSDRVCTGNITDSRFIWPDSGNIKCRNMRLVSNRSIKYESKYLQMRLLYYHHYLITVAKK